MGLIRGSVPFTIDAPYTLVLPDGDPPARGLPLLLALHGLADDGGRLLARLEPLDAGYAVLAPDGPFPVELRQETPPRIGRAWYQYTGDQPAYRAALARAAEHLERVVAHASARHPIDRTRIALLGYSQGGYLAGAMALEQAERYRGLVAIACRVKTEILDGHLERARGLKVLALHGAQDESVKLAPQEAAIAELVRAGVDARLHVHPGGHGLSRDLVPVIAAFVRELLLG